MKKPIAVIALGGNALQNKGEKLTISSQINNAQKAMHYISRLAKKYSLVITHGNGPQVGNILIRSETALGRAYSLPLDICVAESEGEIGYILEQSLIEQLRKNKQKSPVVTILTQVLVDKKDKAFTNPTKPIGPFYTKSHTQIFSKNKIPFIEDSKRGYRRVVASPKPIKIIEEDIIKKLVEEEVIVIAAGGGGIPVIKENKKNNNKLTGIEAVIDKDFASSCLANSIKADIMIILTSVDNVYIDYETRKQKKLTKININEAQKYLKQNQFAEGSMKPKIEASIDFLRHGKNKNIKVIITSPQKLEKALLGRAGTTITKR